jgi:hypothetical protein
MAPFVTYPACSSTTSLVVSDKTQRTTAFEELLIFDELQSAMSTHQEKFYQYMISHGVAVYGADISQMLEDISIYGLDESPHNREAHQL